METGTLQWKEEIIMTIIIILCIVGILAIIAELVLPGGVIGIAGAISLFVAVGMIFSQYGAAAGLTASICLLIFGVATMSLWMKNFHRLPITKKFILHKQVGEDDALTHLQGIVGKTGKTVTEISPSGHAIIDDEKIDVMTEAGSISKGVTVEVVSTKGPSIFVREVKDES